MYSTVGTVIYGNAGQYFDSPFLGTAPHIPARITYGVPALDPAQCLASKVVFGHSSIKVHLGRDFAFVLALYIGSLLSAILSVSMWLYLDWHVQFGN